MLNTYEAETDNQGNLCMPEGVKLPEGCRVLITVLETLPEETANDEALLSETALREDWDNPDEDNEWNCLNREK